MMRVLLVVASLTAVLYVNATCPTVLKGNPCNPSTEDDCCVSAGMLAQCFRNSNPAPGDSALGYWDIEFCSCAEDDNGFGQCNPYS